MQFLLRCGPQLEWVVTENDCASINIHSHFETEHGTRFLNFNGEAMVSTLDGETTVSMFMPSL